MTTGALSPRLSVSGWSRYLYTPRRAGCPEPGSPPGTLFRTGGTARTASQPQVRQREPADGLEDAARTRPGRRQDAALDPEPAGARQADF